MADSYTSSEVSLIYDGGIAAGGELHLYEYSRAVYAYSRLLQTIEYYRRQGIVAERIVGSANTDIIIRAPQQGSFIINATVRAAEKVLPFLRNVPFESVLSFVIDTLKEGPREATIAQRLARIAAREAANRSAVSASPGSVKALEAIAAGEQPSTKQTLALANWARKSSSPSIQRAGISQADLSELLLETQADLQRKERLEPFAEELRRIPAADLAHLTSRVRPMVSEVGLPLRKSASRLSFATGVKREPIARLDIDDIRSINSRSISEEAEYLTASIKSYDRETGHGRLRLTEDDKVYSFSVLSYLRKTLNGRIAAGLDQDTVVFVAQEVKDMSGRVTSYLVSGIDSDIDEEDL